MDPDNKRMPKGNNTYYLLKKSTVPTIIVECGFLSNQAEADKLVTGAYQERLAFHIAMAVMQYVSGMQKRRQPDTLIRKRKNVRKCVRR